MTTILTSIHGHKVGLDVDGYLTTPVGIKSPKYFIGASGSEIDENLVTTASTGTTITAGGVAQITSSTSGSYTLAAPVVGTFKTLVTTSSSTLDRLVTLASGNFLTTASATMVSITFKEPGNSVQLVGLTTALYAVLGTVGLSTATVVFA